MIQKNDLRQPSGNPTIVMTGSNKMYPDARLSVQDGFFHIDNVSFGGFQATWKYRVDKFQFRFTFDFYWSWIA